MPTTKDVQIEIQAICIEIAKMLCDKNERYGNSSIEPKRIFSSSSPIEQINVRIDDKLSRIKHATDTGVEDNEDAELDLIGYLILKRAARNLAMKDTKSEATKYPNIQTLKGFLDRRLFGTAAYKVTTAWLEEVVSTQYDGEWSKTLDELFYCMKELGWTLDVPKGVWVQGSKPEPTQNPDIQALKEFLSKRLMSGCKLITRGALHSIITREYTLPWTNADVDRCMINLGWSTPNNLEGDWIRE